MLAPYLIELPTELLAEVEAIPASYPTTPSGLSTAAAALDPDMIWQRIEAYVGWRWTEREVIWMVSGPGHWEPPLKPANVTATEVWNYSTEAWEAVTLTTTPLGGYLLPDERYHRFTATVGSNSGVPSAAEEAFRLLAEYWAETGDKPGVSSFSASVGEIDESYHRNAAWIARAMQWSGAGDHLRIYRRLK